MEIVKSDSGEVRSHTQQDDNSGTENLELSRTYLGKSPDVDAGWAKVIAGASFCASAIASGVYFTFSMYFPHLLHEFQGSRALTAWVGSLNNGVYMLAGPIASMFIRRIGCRYTIMLGGFTSMIGFALSSLAPNLTMLFITYGVINAFGLCLNYTSWIVAISDSFQKKHALAFSLSQSGVGIGIFIFGPLFSFVISTYGWRGAFLITGGCTFQLTCLGALIFPPRPPQVEEKEIDPENLPLHTEDKQTETERKHVSKYIPDSKVETNVETKVYAARNSTKRLSYCAWMLHLSSLFWLLATSIPYILLADYTQSLDLEKYYIIMLSSMGVGDLIARLAIGPLVTFLKIDVTKLYAISQLLCAISIVSFTLVVDGVQMIVQGIIFSILYGLQCVLLALVPRDIFGSENLNDIFGMTMFFGGAGILVGPPIAGLLVDITRDRSYWLAFVFASLIQLLASAATAGCLCVKRKT